MPFWGGLFLALAVAADAGTIEWLRLQGGHAIRGEVLKDRGDSLVVDIGVDVLVIPKGQVVGRSTAEPSGPMASAPRRSVAETSDLYATAELPIAPIKDLVNRFGEGVVLVKTPSGSGSGFLVDEKGHCVTNYHVIEGETRITVDIFQKMGSSFVERSISDVEIVALNPFFDLALLRIPLPVDLKLPRCYLASEEEIRQGDIAFAIGNPLGLTRSVTQGIISNKNRNIFGQLYIQTTTQINPGNSGGPLFNHRGQVIGVTNMRVMQGEGIAFAIPVNYVKDFLANREAFAYNKDNPNTGYRYLDPPRRREPLAARSAEPKSH